MGDDAQCSNYRPQEIIALANLDLVDGTAWQSKRDLKDAIVIEDSRLNGKYLCVSAVDRAGNRSLTAASTPLAINVAPELTSKKLKVAEHHHARAISPIKITTLLAQDQNPEDSQHLSYFILAGDEGKFILDEKTGVLTSNGELDFEVKSTYTLQVQVRDPLGLTADATVEIILQDVDEKPPVIVKVKDQRIQRNRPVHIPLDISDDIAIKSIEIIGLPAGLSYDKDQKAIVGQTADRVKNRTIKIIVRDTTDNEATESFIMTMPSTAVDDSPT